MMRKMGLLEIGKNAKYYNPGERTEIKLEKNETLEILRGYKTSVSINDTNMNLLIDFASRVLRK